MTESNDLSTIGEEETSHMQTGSGNTVTCSGDDKISESKPKDNVISTAESNAINIHRLVVFCVLVVAAVCVGFLVFIITSNGEETEFESQYRGTSEQLVDAFDGILTKKIGMLGALRVTIMEEGLSQENQTWPFVSLSSYQRRVSAFLQLSNSVAVFLAPIVNDTMKDQWEVYVSQNAPIWMEESRQHISLSKVNILGVAANRTNHTIPNITMNGGVQDPGPGPYVPTWQISPLIGTAININMLKYVEETKDALAGKAIFGNFLWSEPGGLTSSNRLTAYYSAMLSTAKQDNVYYDGDVLSHVFLPVFDSYDKDIQNVVALVVGFVRWGAYLENVLPNHTKSIDFVLETPCKGPFTYRVNGAEVEFIGQGDLHDHSFDSYKVNATFSKFDKIQDGTEYGIDFNNTYCPITINIYPTQQYYDEYNTELPLILTVTVLVVFLFTIVVFLFYDRLVERRHGLVLSKALQSRAIVSSLFPTIIANRMLEQSDTVTPRDSERMSNKRKLKSLLGDNSVDAANAQPLADLFLNTTVLFSDISGFTAWSSAREPLQVFILLQSVYQAFDAIAKRRKVFKVETIGDSYVAVTGLPNPQKNHAAIMARFASECMQKMKSVTSKLDSSLGPGTSDLSMRMGINSGPVTGGVLVGDKARFQLFGDTVNMAARMESSGVAGRIQVSSSTALLLTEEGKGHWVTARADNVAIRGKGILNTYWLSIRNDSYQDKTSGTAVSSSEDENASSHIDNELAPNEKDNARLIDWICELLQTHIKKIMATRSINTGIDADDKVEIEPLTPESTPLDEVVEAMVIPDFKGNQRNVSSVSIESLSLDSAAVRQLRELVSVIAATYRDNPFHNFEHACHVTMSVKKLLVRIVAPDIDLAEVETSQISSHVHDYTHGISDDPISQCAIIFAAVIHDADHRGVSNAQLANEDALMASIYRNKSVAEQNSLDIAWTLLMSDSFVDLRKCMFATKEELQRFRQVVVNTVLATDIFDKELNDLRKQRWDKAFSSDSEMTVQERKNLQATIVIEHLMQASDVAHTMQHWHVYRKWNANLFKELYLAHSTGRMEANPCNFWYKGELGFFDNYIIPLAKKLKECNVFGVSSDEYLNYAEGNRAEWEVRGQQLLQEMIEEVTTNLHM